MIGLFSGNTLLFGPLKFKAIFDAKMFRDYPQVMLNFIASKRFFNFKVYFFFLFKLDMRLSSGRFSNKFLHVNDDIFRTRWNPSLAGYAPDKCKPI